MNVIEKSLVDYDDELIAFVNSDQFPIFAKIVERFYFETLIELHKDNKEEKLESINARAKTYLNLPVKFEYLKNMIIENRKKARIEEV